MKDKFFSTLKRKCVGDEEYANSKIFYITLKMRDISDLNYLYNAQDVILLCKIFENRVQIMYEKSMYNHQKKNLASKFNGYIQKEQSKVILALPTNSSTLEIFEATITGGFSCVNTRLSFDTEILMPNFKKATMTT